MFFVNKDSIKGRKMDFRKLILPTKIVEEKGHIIKKVICKSDDMVFIDTWKEVLKNNEASLPTQLTDLAMLNQAKRVKVKTIFKDFAVDTDNGYSILRDYTGTRNTIHADGMGEKVELDSGRSSGVIAPVVNLKIDETTISDLKEIFENASNLTEHSLTKSKKDTSKIINLGEYPQSLVSKELTPLLEEMYSQKDERLKKTGRFFSNLTGTNRVDVKILAELEYNGQRYVRLPIDYNSSSYLEKTSGFAWFKVEPIMWRVRNFDELPKELNPNGNGKAKTINLKSVYGLVGGLAYGANNALIRPITWNESAIRSYLNGYSDGRLLQIDPNFSFLNEAFNLSRGEIKEYYVLEGQKIIYDNAFIDCDFDTIYLNKNITITGYKTFDLNKYKYFFYDESKKQYVITTQEEKIRNAQMVLDLQKLKTVLSTINFTTLIDDELFPYIIQLTEKLYKANIQLKPSIFSDFVKVMCNGVELDFTFLSKCENLKEQLKTADDLTATRFYRFMYAIGCFDSRKICDKYGVETSTPFSQKATNFVDSVVRNGELKLESTIDTLGRFVLKNVANSELIDFLTKRNGRQQYENFETLLSLTEGKPLMFSSIILNFEKASKFRTGLDERGLPIKRSWKDAFKKYYTAEKYKNVTEDNQDIAELFAMYGVSERVFEQATDLKKEARANDVKSHFLKKSLKEKNILSTIEEIAQQTGKTLQESKALLKDLYKGHFTYEFLDKHDPINMILGLFTSCCATIDSPYYGRNIATYSYVSNDIQNLVVRNYNGQIVAKGAMYLNREKGYAVINAFELNNGINATKGMKLSESQLARRQVCEKVFEAFMRGIDAFVKEYNEENPTNPLNQINVGMGSNSLYSQCERYKSGFLTVPEEYDFYDAERNQKVLYKRGENTLLMQGQEDDQIIC